MNQLEFTLLLNKEKARTRKAMASIIANLDNLNAFVVKAADVFTCDEARVIFTCGYIHAGNLLCKTPGLCEECAEKEVRAFGELESTFSSAKPAELMMLKAVQLPKFPTVEHKAIFTYGITLVKCFIYDKSLVEQASMN
jgi:hypothetical protein